MKLNTLVRHVRESSKSLVRNGWMTFASISSVTVTLLLVGIFLVIMLNLNEIARSIESDVEIRVHIDLTATEEEQSILEKQIKQIPEVDQVTFSSKERELTEIIESFGEEGKAFESLKDENPLNDVFVVKTKIPEDTPAAAKKIETLAHVDRVNYGEDTVKKLFEVVNVARNIGIVLIVGLIFTAMFLIANTIRITIVARRREIEIMKLVGATNSFIRWPFFLEGMFLGLLGSIIPVTLLIFGYQELYNIVHPKIESSFIQILPVYPFTIQLAGMLVALGAFIGIWGSVMSVRKFLKV